MPSLGNFGRPFDWNGIAISATITIILLINAAFEFRRMKRRIRLIFI